MKFQNVPSQAYTKKTTQAGFTLVEMIVSLGIFTIVALVAVGALLKITDANKKAQSLKTAINNLNFALESMSREMRVGEMYHCEENVTPGTGVPITGIRNLTVKGCTMQSDGDWLVAFKSSVRRPKDDGSGDCSIVHAYWNTTITDDPDSPYTIKKAIQPTCEQNSLVRDDFTELLSPEINITSSLFSIDTITDHPAKAFFWLKGYAGARERDKTEFEVQTTISQRN